MAAAEETIVGGQGGGMCGFEHQVMCFVDQRLLFLCELSPQQEHHIFPLFGYFAYGHIGEFGPADAGMTHGFIGPYGERGVEQ